MRGKEKHEKFRVDSILRRVFLVQICRLFELFTLLVAMLTVPGCVYVLESVFFLNVEVFGVNDSLGERIRVSSVGNVELIFKNWFTFRGREDVKYSREPNLASDLFTQRFRGVTFGIKQNTFAKVYHEFVNSTTGSSF